MVYVGQDGLYFRSLEDCGYDVVAVFDEEVVTDDTLRERFSLPDGIDLYGIFSYFFDGDVQSDFEMLSALFNGMLLDTEPCFCINVGRTFSWFVLINGKVTYRGSLTFEGDGSLFNMGRFYKRLRFRIAMSGYGLDRLYSDNHMFKYPADSLSELMWGYQPGTALMMLSTHLQPNREITAKALVNVMSWHFQVVNRRLYPRGRLCKDFSICTSTITGYSDCTYGVIIDCEGKIGINGDLSAGCRELGGLIWCRRKEILISMEQFSCDEKLFEDTLIRVMQSMKSYNGGRSIQVLTFGKSDKKMFTSSLNAVCNRKVIKQVSNTFKFVDCKGFIDEYTSGLQQKGTLSNIARYLGVKVVTPRHKALNDARTLLNVLAVLLYKTGRFL